jgi:Heterokaryon incompatibility protein (HET)
LDDKAGFFDRKLKNCLKNHTETCGRAGRHDAPKRLLDIGARDGDVIKLVERKARGVKYAIVSHRWAEDGKMFRTLGGNIEQRLTSIDEKGMPSVLQDAIKVARAFRLRYLWIDTICVIQGDEKDTAEEMPKMGDYYENAYFTIATSSSKDSTERFLKRRDSYYAPQKLSFGEGSTVHVRLLGVEGYLAKRVCSATIDAGINS